MVIHYDKALEMRNYKEASRKKIIQLIKHFLRTVSLPCETITPANVENYLISLKEEGRSGKTINNHKSAIKGFYDFLMIHQVTADNPAEKIQRLELDEEIPVFIPDNEIDMLLKLAEDEKIYCEVVLALNTGLRVGELRNLTWKDIDLELKQLIVRESKGKRPRTVPLNQKAITVLEEQKAKYEQLIYVFPGGKGGKGCTNRWTEPQKRGWDWWKKTAFQNIKEKIPTLHNLKNGRTGRNWHALRHTFATKLARAGIDIFKLKDWLGHKKMETTMRYIHLARHYDPDIELI